MEAPAEPAPPVVDFTKLPSSPPPPPPAATRPEKPTLQDIYALIDERLSTKIVERLSSSPPPASVAPRPSMPVRAAKATKRWTKALMTITGGVLMLLQGVAWVEDHRGPIQQGVAVIGTLLDLWEANRVVDDPEHVPEP